MYYSIHVMVTSLAPYKDAVGTALTNLLCHLHM